MQVAIVLKKDGTEDRKHLVTLDREEMRLMIEVFEKFCAANKKQGRARALLGQMAKLFQCW